MYADTSGIRPPGVPGPVAAMLVGGESGMREAGNLEEVDGEGDLE